MFQWIKKKIRQYKLNRLKKRDEEVFLLKKKINEVEILYTIKRKQFNDFMVESELEINKYKDLLKKEKDTNGKLLKSRNLQIGNLKEELKNLKKENSKLKENNQTLKHTLGHF